MSSIQILLAGVDYIGIIDLDTVSIQDAIGERSTASFLLNDLTNTLALAPGETVEIWHENQRVFGGTIDRRRQTKLPGTTPHRQYQIECVDWHQLCDRKIVSEAYQNQTASAIVADLISKYLAMEGIWYDEAADTFFLQPAYPAPTASTTTVAGDTVVVEAVFNYIPLTQCFDAVAERVGCNWWIDPDKRIHFQERSAYAAPWTLDNPELVNDLEVEGSREGYRNRQYIRAGKDITDSQIESFKGDGSSRTFTVGFPIAKVPMVKVNTVAKTVGIKGLDTGKDWYWSKGDPVVTQDQTGVVLTAGDTLEVTYQGLFDVVVLTIDQGAVTERQNVEGGSGWYDSVEDEPYLSSREAAFQSANAKLQRYTKMPKTITFNTWHHGLRPGQILTVNLPDRGLSNEEFLIEEISFSRIGGDYWQYDVRAVSGATLGGWTKFFRNMATRGQTFVVRENIMEDQVLVYLVQVSEAWGWGEASNVLVFACPIPSTSLYPSSILYPC